MFSVGRVTRFYVPLLVQAFSQSLSYPLVAGVVTHGPLGVDALTAFSQGLMVMFVIGSIGGGLITTGLVFAKTWVGYVAFRRLNAYMMAALLALQCVPALPPFREWVFSGIFALSPELASVAANTLLCSVVMNGCFFLRNLPMVVLFDNLESGKANNATLLRIVATLALAVALPRAGLVGAWWGLFALTAGVVVELVVTWLYARPYVRALRRGESNVDMSALPDIPRLTVEQFRFTMPLALGGFLLMLSPVIVAAFVGRTVDARDMLAIHYVVLGVANPVAFAALRMQPVAIKFPPEYAGDRRLLAYAVVAGLLLGLVPLAFATPWLGDIYFGIYQNVPPRILPTARLAVGIYALIAVVQAVRARVEGLAAHAKRPKAIMAGQIAYTVSLLATCAAMLPTGAPGWVMAETAIFVAPMCVTATVYAMLAAPAAGRAVAWTRLAGWLRAAARIAKGNAFGMSVLACAAVAFAFPGAFLQWGDVKLITLVGPAIQLIMFGMGTTLAPSDFLRVAKRPWAVALGITLQFAIMPLVGYLIAKACGFTGELAAGCVLVGSVAGGTASNVIAFLAKADVALSVTMTCCSTLLSPLATPLAMSLLAGTFVEIDAANMMVEILKIVVVPVLAGGLVHRLFARQFAERKALIDRGLSILSMCGICFTIIAITAPSRGVFAEAGALIVVAAVAHNTIGYVSGYVLTRLAGRFIGGLGEREARTVAIEVGMQNGGMAAALSVGVLKSAVAALPANIFSIWMDFSGSVLANAMAKRPVAASRGNSPAISGRRA